MNIKSAEFVISNTDYKKCPDTELPEYAFIGRSNVGKSSLINMLTQRPNLAKTSSKPGKTLLINHFFINGEWYLVDLPGYGYARASKTQRAQLKGIVDGYIMFRPQLSNLFVLIDCRLEPQEIDLEFLSWLGLNAIPFAIVFTKGDKLSKAKLEQNVEAYKVKLLESWESLPPVFVTASEKGGGRDEILDYIEEINTAIANEA